MVPDNLSVDNLLISVVIMLISWGDNLSVEKMWITGWGVLITLYDNMSPPPLLAWGYRPPLPSRIPPYICHFVRYGGIIPYITLK